MRERCSRLTSTTYSYYSLNLLFANGPKVQNVNRVVPHIRMLKATSGAMPATVAKISELCRSLVLLPDDSSWTLVSTSVVDHCIAFRRNDQIMSSVLTRPHLRFAQGRRSALKFLLESLLMSLHPN